MKRLILAVAALSAATAVHAQTQIKSADLERGEALFHHTCFVCHAQGAPAAAVLAKRLGPDKSLLAQRTDLAPAYIRNAVRRGIGSMPWMTRVEVTDADLAAIAAYLTRNNPPTAAR